MIERRQAAESRCGDDGGDGAWQRPDDHVGDVGSSRGLGKKRRSKRFFALNRDNPLKTLDSASEKKGKGKKSALIQGVSKH
jgi:hypothetical protein